LLEAQTIKINIFLFYCLEGKKQKIFKFLSIIFSFAVLSTANEKIFSLRSLRLSGEYFLPV